MSSTSPASGRSRDRLIFVAAALLVGFVAGSIPLRDPDAFHLLALGREIWRGGLPSGEPFLFPFADGGPSPTASWLFAVLLFGAQRIVGLQGIVVLQAVLISATAGVLAHDVITRREGRAVLVAAALPVLLAIWGLRVRAAPRPEVVATLLLAIELYALRRLGEGARWPVVWVPVALVFWVNVHPSAVAGFGVALIYLLHRVVTRQPLRDHAIVLGACMAALFVSPAPWTPVVNAVSMAASQLGMETGVAEAQRRALEVIGASVTELRALGWPELKHAFGGMLVLTVVGFAFVRGGGRLLAAMLVAPFVALAISAVRFTAMADIVMAPVAAAGLHHALARWDSARVRKAAPVVTALLAACVLAVEVISPVGGVGWTWSSEKHPVRPAAYLRQINFDGRLYNTFSMGGFLEWTLDRPIFQDGRALLHPEDALPALGGPTYDALFAGLDARYGFDALAVAYLDPNTLRYWAAQRRSIHEDWLADRRVWSLVAFDGGGMLYLRRDGKYAEAARRDEYHAVLPGNPYPDHRVAEDPQFRAVLTSELGRAVRESPACVGCRRYLERAKRAP